MIRVYVWCMHPITPFQYVKPYQLWSQPADTLRQPSSQFQQLRWTTLSSFPGKPWLTSLNPISLGSSLISVQHLLGTPFSPCEVPHASVSNNKRERKRERERERERERSCVGRGRDTHGNAERVVRDFTTICWGLPEGQRQGVHLAIVIHAPAAQLPGCVVWIRVIEVGRASAVFRLVKKAPHRTSMHAPRGNGKPIESLRHLCRGC